MAEQPNRKKRRIKNPETFRERMQRGAETSEKASAKKARLKRPTGSLARGGKKLLGVKPLRPIRKVLSILAKVLVPSYFRQSWQELKLVTWPNWQESRRLTSAVLIFAIIFGAVIATVDWGLDKLFHQLLLK